MNSLKYTSPGLSPDILDTCQEWVSDFKHLQPSSSQSWYLQPASLLLGHPLRYLKQLHYPRALATSWSWGSCFFSQGAHEENAHRAGEQIGVESDYLTQSHSTRTGPAQILLHLLQDCSYAAMKFTQIQALCKAKTPFCSCIVHLFVLAFTPSCLHLLWKQQSWCTAF